MAISELERVSQREEGEVEEKVRKVAMTRRESSASCEPAVSLFRETQSAGLRGIGRNGERRGGGKGGSTGEEGVSWRACWRVGGTHPESSNEPKSRHKRA